MSRQINQNAGQKADAFSETFRLAKEAEHRRLAEERADKNAALVAEAREMQNSFTKAGRKGSGSVRGRGSGRGSRGRQTASSPTPRKVDIPSRFPQEFTNSDFTSRTGVNTEYPGRGGFSPAVGGMISLTNRQRENQGFVSQQAQRVSNHQVGSYQQEKQYTMGHQAQQAANHQVAGFQQHETERFMGHQTCQVVDNQATGVQQQESQHRMGHQTPQPVNNQFTGVQQKENERFMGHQTLQRIDNQVVNHHAEAMSTGIDVEMVDVETSTGSRKTGMSPRVSKNGGMKDSIWAKPEKKENAYSSTAYVPTMSSRGSKNMTSTSTQRFADDGDIERWVPAFVSDPTPVPSHLVQQTQTRGVPRQVDSGPRIQASPAGPRPSTGPRGGLAKSQWA